MKHDSPPAGFAPQPKLRGDVGVIALFGTIAALYFTREILIPFAFALTLTFLLTPVVALLQRLRTGRVVAVLTTVLVSIAVAGGIGWIIANQLMDVANQLPLYRQNIHAKIEAFHIPVTGQLGQASESVKDIVRELSSPEMASSAAPRQAQQAEAAACGGCISVAVARPNGRTPDKRMGGASRSWDARSWASGTSRNCFCLYGLHADQERGLEEPSFAAGGARSVKPHDASARRRGRTRQPIHPHAVPGQCWVLEHCLALDST